MKIENKILTLGASLLFAGASTQAGTITAWNFDGQTVAAPYNSPAPSTGSGTASVLGMLNTYNSSSSSPSADVLPTVGASTPNSSAWRIRGTPGNGWSSQAPIGTQGAEFDASTAGYQNISVSFDLYFTTQAPAKMQLEYTTDGVNWLNSSQLTYAANPGYILNNSSSPNTVSGTYFYETGGQNFYNGIAADLSGVSAANNNSSFGIRIVNAATDGDNLNAQGTAYNNNSGNWRFDNVVISGVAVPEPSALALIGLGLSGLAWQIRRRNS